MLVSQPRLNSALENVLERNSLISELIDVPLQDENGAAARVLAIWLGDNAGLEKTNGLAVLPCPISYLMAGYHYFLILDLLSTMSVESDHQLHLNINDIRQQCFEYFNQHHQLLISNPESLFDQFHRILMGNNVVGSNDKLSPIYRNRFEECRQLLIHAGDFNYQREKNIRVSIGSKSRLINLNSENFSRQTTRLISCALFSYLYFESSSLTYFEDTVRVQKVFVPSDDKVILDALYIKNTLTPKKTLIIALIGHFQVEHYYIARAVHDFYKFFEEDMLFINHRNYAVRSANLAVNTRELSGDVVAFFNHYRNQYENIVLYGMCGGAATMILAAQTLTKKNVKYKLIVDRFFSQYNNCFDIKTVKRAWQVIAPIYREHSLPLVRFMRSTPGYVMLLIIFMIFAAILRLMLLLSRNDMHFGKIIASLPAEDVLILQVKGVKQADKSYPLDTDLFVHPANDLRKAVKPRRHDIKEIFKHLRDNALIISQECELTQAQNIVKLRNLFFNIHLFFNASLQLINNEKLKGSFTDPVAKDLHSSYLYWLSTRHQLSLSRFLHGFFESPTGKMDDSLSKFDKFCRDDFLSLLSGDDWPQAPAFDKSREMISDAMAAFFDGYKTHRRLIGYYGDRLYASGDTSGEVFDDLIKSDIYQSLQSHRLTRISYA